MIGTMLGVLFICLLGTVPIAVSLGLSCVATFSVFNAGSNMTQMLAQSTVTSIDSFSLMAIPFFMLVGSLMERGGIAKKLVDVAEMLTGTMPGGLGMAAMIKTNHREGTRSLGKPYVSPQKFMIYFQFNINKHSLSSH